MPKMMELLRDVKAALKNEQLVDKSLLARVDEAIELTRAATGDLTVRITEEQLTALCHDAGADIPGPTSPLERALLELALWRKLK